jgi:hypothetical protein
MMQTFVITIPKNQTRAEETKTHLQQCGFPQIQFVYGYTAPPGGNMLRSASKSHYKAAKYASRFKNPVIIAEDDCRVATQHAMTKIVEAVEYLNHTRPTWQLLAIGHCGLGPIWPLADYPDLCYSTLPFSGICYILNPNTLRSLLHKVPLRKWRRPFMIEGWLSLGVTRKYAFTMSLTTMGNVPKEIAKIPFISKLDLTAATHTVSHINLVVYPLIVYCVVVFLMRQNRILFV